MIDKGHGTDQRKPPHFLDHGENGDQDDDDRNHHQQINEREGWNEV